MKELSQLSWQIEQWVLRTHQHEPSQAGAITVLNCPSPYFVDEATAALAVATAGGAQQLRSDFAEYNRDRSAALAAFQAEGTPHRWHELQLTAARFSERVCLLDQQVADGPVAVPRGDAQVLERLSDKHEKRLHSILALDRTHFKLSDLLDHKPEDSERKDLWRSVCFLRHKGYIGEPDKAGVYKILPSAGTYGHDHPKDQQGGRTKPLS
jgi:hypothetical protein